MTAEQLRNSILQEAISGRLVPQDPNDEPASVLLQHIREEKARLVKEGKLKKKDLAETPITAEEIPFEIPASWAWVRWGNLAFSIMYGYNAPAEDNGDIRMVRISDIQDNKVLWHKVPFCKIKPSDIETYLLKPNDILFARTGGTVGKSYIVNDVPYPSIYAGYLIRTQYSEQLCPNYLKYFMESRLYWSQLRDETIATAQPNCNGKKLAAMMLPLPPLAEQKRIVAKLEELLPIVEQYGKAQKELDELNAALPARLRQSILQEAISGRLVPQDPNDGKVDTLLDDVSRIKQQMLIRKEIKKGSLVSIPIEDEEIEYSIPDSWRFVRLQDICTCIFSGKSPKYSQIPTKHKIIGQQSNQWTGVEMRYVKYGTDEYAKDIPQIQYLQDHDVLLNTLGNGTLGRSGIYYSSYSNTPVLTDGHIFVLRTPHEVTAKYILAYLRVKFVDINRSADGSTNQTFLNLTKTSKWIIPLPPLAEQQRIVAKIEELFAEIDKMK